MAQETPVKSTLREKLVTIGWAFSVAWRIDKKMLLVWSALSVGLAVLPAVMLNYNREVISQISHFLTDGTGAFSDVIPSIVTLGLLMTVIGLSTRVNGDLIYMMMYDSYYMGLQELMTESIQKIEMTDLMKSELYDDYSYAVNRAGSLNDLMSGFCAIAGKIVAIVSLLVVAYLSSHMVFIISLIYVIGVFILNFSFTEKLRWNGQKIRKLERLASYFEKMPETPGTAKEIRVYENTQQVVDHWSRAYAHVEKYDMDRSFATELRNFISGIGFYLFLIVMMAVCLFSVAKGALTTDVFLMLYALCMNMFGAISGTARSIMGFDYGLFSLERQRKFFNMAPYRDPEEEASKADTPLDEQTVFNVRNLTFCYKGDVPAIDNVSFSINRGEVVALVGHNGSGKSTLVKLLLNMYKPTSGQLEMYGRAYGEYKRDFLRKRIGVFFQDFFLFHHTLRENVAYGDIDNIGDERKILHALERGGAARILDKAPFGLQTLIGRGVDKSGIELSGGEKQRLGSARAHMSGKEILIFDEPASMLDPIAEMEQFMNIQQKLHGRTAILISHRVGFARMADRIIMLDHGKIAETGTHEELMAKDGLYADFFNQQAQWYQKTARGEDGVA